MKLLVLDAGGSGIKHAVIDEQLNILGLGVRKNDFKNKEGFLDAIQDIIDDTKESFEGIAVSYCGKMNPDTGELSNPGYYRYMHGTNLKILIEEKTGYHVKMENDGNCAALAEMEYGSLKEYKSACALVIGTGLGLALIQDRKIWHGANFNAGLASFMVSGYDVPANHENMIFHHTGYGYLITTYAQRKGLRTEKMNGKLFFEAYLDGDEIAAEILKIYCHNVAYVIYNLQMILDVEAFAIGGGISAQPVLIEEIDRELNAIYDGIGIPMKRPQIKACRFFNESNLIGAYCHYISRQS